MPRAQASAVAAEFQHMTQTIEIAIRGGDIAAVLAIMRTDIFRNSQRRSVEARLAPLSKENGVRLVLLGLVMEQQLNETRLLVEAMRRNTLEARVAALEARPDLKYCGVWDRKNAYRENELVTHGGSLWIARGATTNQPGTDENWTLCAKRGSSGKGAR